MSMMVFSDDANLAPVPPGVLNNVSTILHSLKQQISRSKLMRWAIIRTLYEFAQIKMCGYSLSNRFSGSQVLFFFRETRE